MTVTPEHSNGPAEAVSPWIEGQLVPLPPGVLVSDPQAVARKMDAVGFRMSPGAYSEGGPE